MAALNKVQIIGNLGKDPEIRYTQSGGAVANFSVAVTEKWKDKQGNLLEKTEWVNVTLWEKLAELAQSYLKKGSSVYIEGKLQTSSWDDQTSGQKRYKTDVVGHSMQFLDSKGRSEGQQGKPTNQNNGQDHRDYVKDDMPF